MDKLSGIQKIYRSKFNLSHRKIFDCDYYKAVPILYQFCLPGDVVSLGANLVIRTLPLMSPSMNKNEVDVRYFFVPLRLIESKFESIVTGSVNGNLVPSVPTLPKYESENRKVSKYSLLDYLGVPLSDSVDWDKFPISDYVPKAFARIWYDYYRDENFNVYEGDEFDVFYRYNKGLLSIDTFDTLLQKNYFTSSLPWQLKGDAPSFDFSLTGFADFSNAVTIKNDDVAFDVGLNSTSPHAKLFAYNDRDGRDAVNNLVEALNKNELVFEQDNQLTVSDLRTIFAQTRIFERLARCGSRYVEYLTSNFGIAPRDDTLQRAQYLGGFRQPIVFSEIAQTGEASANPVGTLRGKGISVGGDMPVKNFVCKEFGVIFGIANFRAELLYTQGIDRTMTYSDRWDFFNPSMQNLSEQTIKNYEIFFDWDDDKNDEDFGFVPMYQELRKSRNMVVGDMRDSLSFWTQPIVFEERPNLNGNFLRGSSYLPALHNIFAETTNTSPFIVDCSNIVNVVRPVSKFSIPGLIDHN